MPALAAVKRGLRKKFRSSIGCELRRSHRKNAARTTAEIANDPRVVALLQPFSGASIRP